MYEIIFLLLGLVGLWLGSEFVIKGAKNIAEHFKISQLFIGLVLLSIGTDLPELFVIITSAFKRTGGIETSGLVIGETIGTCFGQIGLMLGIVALFGTLRITKKKILRDGVMMLASVILVFLAGVDGFVSMEEGLILFAIWLLYLYSLNREEQIISKFKRAKKMHFEYDVLTLIIGFAILIYSSKAVVDSAVTLSEIWNVSQSLIGVVIVGLGTSLPELAVSMNSVKKGLGDLAVGNLIGSNIIDLLAVLGIGAAISGFNVEPSLLYFDFPALLLLSLGVLYMFKTKLKIEKWEAFALISMYVVYIIAKIFGA